MPGEGTGNTVGTTEDTAGAKDRQRAREKNGAGGGGKRVEAVRKGACLDRGEEWWGCGPPERRETG